MYIDTTTKETLQNSIITLFNISEDMLECFFEKVYESEKSVEDEINLFILERAIDKSIITEIEFYHLSRRLNNCDFKIGYNLYTLLLEDTEVAAFLRERDIEFKMGDGHLLLYHHGIHEELNDNSRPGVANVRWRMGYLKDYGREDYCFNGFAFKDALHNNSYINSLRLCPEFIGQLAIVIDREDIINDYVNNSEYYLIKYIVPLEKVIFDGIRCNNSEEKVTYLMSLSLLRLYKYWNNDHYGTYDNDNLILRLEDDDIMGQEFFVSADKI